MSVTNTTKMVVIAIAEDLELAKQYVSLLREYFIGAATKSRGKKVDAFNTMILVPEDQLDEAYTLVEARLVSNFPVSSLPQPMDGTENHPHNPNRAA